MEKHTQPKQIIIPNNKSYLTGYVLQTLQNSPPMTSKEIKFLIQQRHGADHVKGFVSIRIVNTILTEFLSGWVKQDANGKWMLIQQNALDVFYYRIKPEIIKAEPHLKPHILFLCSNNKWRSLTAEKLYQYDERIEVRTAGVSSESLHPLTANDIQWADLILLLEKYCRVPSSFENIETPLIREAWIPDEYEKLDDRLTDSIRRSVEYHLKNTVK